MARGQHAQRQHYRITLRRCPSVLGIRHLYRGPDGTDIGVCKGARGWLRVLEASTQLSVVLLFGALWSCLFVTIY